MFYDGVFLSKIKNPNNVKIEIDGMSKGRHEIRIVAVADTPTANRRSQQFEFTVE